MIDDKDKKAVEETLTKHGDVVPDNFVRTAPAYQHQVQFQPAPINPQVTALLSLIGVATPESAVQTAPNTQPQSVPVPNPEEIQLDL